MSSSFSVPRTPRDLLVPPTPSGTLERPRGPLTFRLPPLSSAVRASITPKASSSKSPRKKPSSSSRKRKRDDLDEDIDDGLDTNPIFYNAPKKPQRLKPLGELLPGLMSRIKKKDDYTFFLRPVDPALAPGYADIVKQPMDFGTMTRKVERGKYKSMDDFKRDLDLVVDNARLYNPPGSIYHSEADKIAQFGHEIIDKALPQLDYSAVEPDGADFDSDSDTMSDSPPPAPLTAAPATPAVPALLQPLVGAQLNTGTSSSRRIKGEPDDPTALLQFAAGGASGQLRRLRVRAHALKDAVKTGEDGSLPGAVDGVAQFPRGHGAAQVLLALKIRPRKVTKKERLRLEKEGPPMRADCSLDFMRIENPLQTLSALLEPEWQRPYVVPQPKVAPLPTDIRKLRTKPPEKIKHWTKGTFKSAATDPPAPATLDAQEVINTDWGVQGLLQAIMNLQQHPRSATAPTETAPVATSANPALDAGNEAALLDRIRTDAVAAPSRSISEHIASSSLTLFPRADVPVQEERLRELVYGGIDGLAYISSIARFVAGAEHARTEWRTEQTVAKRQREQDLKELLGDDMEGVLVDIPSPKSETEQLLEDAPMDDGEPETQAAEAAGEQKPEPGTTAQVARRGKRKWRHGPLNSSSLASYVEHEIILPLTGGLHEVLAVAGDILIHRSAAPSDSSTARLIFNALNTLAPQRARHREMLVAAGDKIDLAAILRSHGELFTAETGWKAMVASHAAQQQQQQQRKRLETPAAVKDEGPEDGLSAMRAAAAQFAKTQTQHEERGPTIVQYALGLTATALEQLAPTPEGAEEDEMQRVLRLQLLALAKRAPIKYIKEVPAALVPPRVRAAFGSMIKSATPDSPAAGPTTTIPTTPATAGAKRTARTGKEKEKAA